MPFISKNHKTADGNKGMDSQSMDATQADCMSSPPEFNSPPMSGQLVSRGSFDIMENELGPSLMNNSASAVYSPFFMQMSYSDRAPSDPNKIYSVSYGDNKNTGMNSETKLAPPMIMLPESAASTLSKTAFTELFSTISESSSLLTECLAQLSHMSKCHNMDGDCEFPWCLGLRRDLFHTMRCKDDKCKQCLLIRPLILIHSISCKEESCQISSCSVYRNSWSVFIHSLQDTPIPKIDTLFWNLLDKSAPVKQEFSETVQPPKKVCTRSSKMTSSNLDYYQDTQHKSPSSSVFPKISLASDLDVTSKSPSYTPLSNYMLPQQEYSAPTSPTPPVSTTSTKSNGDTVKTASNFLSSQYIKCCKCGKHRAVPSSLDVQLLPHFECCMNIWDDGKYNSCTCEENVDLNYVINLSHKGISYEQDSTVFVNKLKNFLATNQIMSYRPPTLGRKEVDLYRLFREVTAYGGCESVVSKEGTWAKIYRGLDNFSPTETSASFRLKRMYTKYLLAYEKQIFDFQPIPAKKHRYSHSPNSTTPPPPMNTTPTVQTQGIQNSAIFPAPVYNNMIQDNMSNTRRQTKLYTVMNGNLSTPNGDMSKLYEAHGSHQSALLTNSTKYTPGAGLGLGGTNYQNRGNIDNSAGLRSTTKRQSTDISRPPLSPSFNGIRDDTSITNHIPISPQSSNMNTRRPSSRSSPLPVHLDMNQGVHTRQQMKRERESMSRSPLLTGEDVEGAAGLQILMSLHSSPTLQALESPWGALLNVASVENGMDKKHSESNVAATLK